MEHSLGSPITQGVWREQSPVEQHRVLPLTYLRRVCAISESTIQMHDVLTVIIATLD